MATIGYGSVLMSDMLQLVVEIGKAQCATLRLVSSLSVHDLDDKLKHVGHYEDTTIGYAILYYSQLTIYD